MIANQKIKLYGTLFSQIQQLISMNNNLRGIRSTSQNQTVGNSAVVTRHSSISGPSSSNIHININLNVKKKTSCLHSAPIAHSAPMAGKKINNFIQINDPKNQIKNSYSAYSDQQEKYTNQLLKNTDMLKRQVLPHSKNQNRPGKQQKAQIKRTKQKFMSKPFTPQKQQKNDSEQKSRSKSKTSKLQHKKYSKSMENIRGSKKQIKSVQNIRKINDMATNQKEQKPKMKQNSNSKERSRSKSSKKLKRNRSSSKNIASFQNSGIKKFLGGEKQKTQPNKNPGHQNLKKSKKSFKNTIKQSEQIVKVRQFMQEKKKKYKNEKEKKQNQMKSIKIKDELMKQQDHKQKRDYQNQKTGIKNKFQENKVPMFFGSDDQNQASLDKRTYFLKEETQNNHSKNSLLKNNSQKKSFSPGKKTKITTYKLVNQSVFDRFQQNKLNKSEKHGFLAKIRKIQSVWRGYKARKLILEEISKINKISKQKKHKILNQNSSFWDDDENNSIINISREELLQSKKSKRNKNNENIHSQILSKNFEFKSPVGSNQHSSQNPSQENHTNHKKYESQSGNSNANQNSSDVLIADFNKNLRFLKTKNDEVAQKQTKKAISEQKSTTQQKNSISFQIEEMRLQIQQQNRRFAQLQRQNNQLKQNLKNLTAQKQKTPAKHKQKRANGLQNNEFQHLDKVRDNILAQQKQEDDTLQIIELKKPESKRQISQSLKVKKQPHQKFKNLKIDTFLQVQNGQEKPATVSNLVNSPSDDYLQSLKRQFQTFQSPSNRSLSNLSSQNVISLQKVFKKKELSIEIAYQKSSKTYQQMLQNNMVSPRTYNFKKIELDQKYKRQKQEIKHKFKEAEKVIKYINEEVVQQQKAGDDQSPQKIQFEIQNQSIKGFNTQDLKEKKVIQNSNNNKAFLDQQSSSKIINKQVQYKQAKAIPERLTQQIQAYHDNELQSSNQESSANNFRRYWTEDAEEVHRKVLQISSRIDEALQSDSKYSESYRSESNQQYSSQNSNINSLEALSHQELIDRHVRTGSQNQLKTPIYEKSEYQIQSRQGKDQPIQNTRNDKNHQIIEVSNNNSIVSSSSDKSSSHSAVYDIHYPSTPSNIQSGHKESKHIFQLKDQIYEEGQNYLQANNSGLSQNRSSLSQKSVSQSRTKQGRGFDTRLTFIKEYCIGLCQFLRSEEDLKKEFVQNISKPLKYDYFQYLKSYRTTLNYEHDTRYNSTLQDYIYPFFKIVSKPTVQKALNDDNCCKFQQLYGHIHNARDELTPQVEDIRKHFLKAIIDVFNQSLDFQRPGSIYGEPLPWLVQSKNLKNNPVKFLMFNSLNSLTNGRNQNESQEQQNQEDERLDKIFGVAIAKIIQWGSCLCGFIPQPVSFDNEQAHSVNIDQEQTNIVRQTRLAYMLQKYLAQNEQWMVDSTMQQLQIQLQVQQMVFHSVIQQIAQEMKEIDQKRYMY